VFHYPLNHVILNSFNSVFRDDEKAGASKKNVIAKERNLMHFKPEKLTIVKLCYIL